MTSSTAVLTNQIGKTFLVTHDYHPSRNPNLYEVTVTIKNISAAVADVRYRRVMDWDIEPTAFSEYVTLETGNATRARVHQRQRLRIRRTRSSPAASIFFTGEAVDSGPADHGSLFDFGFGTLAPGAEKTFLTYYGAAATEAERAQMRSARSAPRHTRSVSRAPPTARRSARRTRSCSGSCTSAARRALGSITIVKDAVPDSRTDFGFTTTGSGLSPFSLDDDADGTLAELHDVHGAPARQLLGDRECGRRVGR